MKRYRFLVLNSAGRVFLALVVAIGVCGLVACGSSSSSKNGAAGEPTAFAFTQDTLRDAAFLAVDKIDVLFPVSQIANAVVELGESDVRQIDLSADFCDGVGTATLTVPPIAPGVDALLAFTDCGGDALTGTAYFRVQNYTAGAQTPNPFMKALVELELTGVEDGVQGRTEAKFQLEAFRDPQSIGFRHFGSDAYFLLTEGTETTKLGCFDFNLRFMLDDEDEIGEIRFGDRDLVDLTPSGVFVDGNNRLFSVTGSWPRQTPPIELIFAEIGDEFEVVDGYGLDFRAEASVPGAKGCAVVGAKDGISPGNTRMTLRPDPDVFGGVILTADPSGAQIKTTWSQILGD